MIELISSGSFDNIERFLKRMQKGDIYSGLEEYGHMGLEALVNATPVDTGLTAEDWGFQIVRYLPYYVSIEWYNKNTEANGTPVAILIQYGHGTGTGGYVQGRDFINPAIRPIFDAIAEDVWKKVKL